MSPAGSTSARDVRGLWRYVRDDGVPQQRLWQRCVFVDWHGVLCDQPFWYSITQNPRHQHYRSMRAAIQRLFQDQGNLIETWMRGMTDAARIVEELPQLQDRRCRPDYLHRRLLADCRKMSPQAELLDILGQLPALTLVVIATDNMDCFSDSVPGLSALNRVFHASLCSSDLGVLKAEDPQRFFGQLLAEHDLRPSDAVLIDDSDRNCWQFKHFGGHAIRFRDVPQAAAELHRWAG